MAESEFLCRSLRKRWSTRSFRFGARRRSRNNSHNAGNGTASADSSLLHEGVCDLSLEAERLLQEREEELRRRLQGFEDGTTK